MTLRDIGWKNLFYLMATLSLYVLNEWVDRVDWSWLPSFPSLGGL
jgi:hypothetical protein